MLRVVIALSFLGLMLAPASTRSESSWSRLPDPEDGTIVDGTYVNDYFHLAYPLPPGWTVGLKTPEVSASGYYVLHTPLPADEPKATLLLAAQDTFFAPGSTASARDMVIAVQADAKRQGMMLDEPPSAVTIGGHVFLRIELRGITLSRIIYITELRCHVMSFIITGYERAPLDQLARSLERVSLPPDDAPSAPLCIKDYASKATILRKVELRAAGAPFAPVPVRIIIGTDGKVRHVHVLRASPGQKRRVEAALQQWEFRPHEVDGRAVEVETGLVFKLAGAGAARE
jgi:hypothetical protein